jgi:hypothetical protein
MTSTIPAPVAKFRTVYHTSGQVNISDKKLDGGWGSTLATIISKLSFFNAVSSHVTVTQEEGQQPVFTATWNLAERMLSTAATGAMVFFAHRLCGRKGIAYAALAQLGLSLGSAIWKSSKWATVQRGLHLEQQKQFGVVTPFAGVKRADETVIRSHLESQVEEPLCKALESEGTWSSYWSGDGKQELSQAFKKIIGEGGSAHLAQFMCMYKKCDDKAMQGVRELLGKDIAAHLAENGNHRAEVMPAIVSINVKGDRRRVLAKLVADIIENVSTLTAYKTAEYCNSSPYPEVGAAVFGALMRAHAKKSKGADAEGGLKEVVAAFEDKNLCAVAEVLPLDSITAFAEVVGSSKAGENQWLIADIDGAMAKTVSALINSDKTAESKILVLTDLKLAFENSALEKFANIRGAIDEAFIAAVTQLDEPADSKVEESEDADSAHVAKVTKLEYILTASDNVLKAMSKVPGLSKELIDAFGEAEFTPAKKQVVVKAVFEMPGALVTHKEIAGFLLNHVATDRTKYSAEVKLLVDQISTHLVDGVEVDLVAFLYTLATTTTIQSAGRDELRSFIVTNLLGSHATSIRDGINYARELKVGDEASAKLVFNEEDFKRVYVDLSSNRSAQNLGVWIGSLGDVTLAKEVTRSYLTQLQKQHKDTLGHLWNSDQTEAKAAVCAFFEGLGDFANTIAEDAAAQISKFDASHFGDFISAAVRDEAKKGDGATYPGAQDAFAPIQAELEKLAKPQPEPTDYQAEE